RTGISAAEAGFWAEVLFVLGIVDSADRLRLREERLHAFLALDAPTRRRRLLAAWLSGSAGRQLAAGLGDDAPYQLQGVAYALTGWQLDLPDGPAAGKIAARLLSRMSPGVWFDTESFRVAFEGFAALALAGVPVVSGYLLGQERAWWL